jgi:hypothetical protein
MYKTEENLVLLLSIYTNLFVSVCLPRIFRSKGGWRDLSLNLGGGVAGEAPGQGGGGGGPSTLSGNSSVTPAQTHQPPTTNQPDRESFSLQPSDFRRYGFQVRDTGV